LGNREFLEIYDRWFSRKIVAWVIILKLLEPQKVWGLEMALKLKTELLVLRWFTIGVEEQIHFHHKRLFDI
jgi:hypothetical protein